MKYYAKYSIKFIIRLIIFYSFIYLISFLTGKSLFISNVNAQVLYPKTITYHTNSGNPTGSLTRGSQSGINISYFNFGAKQYVNNITFNYDDLPSSLMNKKLSFSGLIWTTTSTDSLPQPFRVWVIDDNTGSSYACSSQSSSSGQLESGISYWNTFKCDNVNITFNSFKIAVGSNFYSAGEIGISNINFDVESNESINSNIKDTNNTIKDTNDTIKDDNVDGSTSQGSSFFNDFESGDVGSLTDIVSLPLDYISHLNDSCSPFVIPAGNLGNITIPCLSSIWSKTSFANVINTASVLINGFICYKLLLNLFYFFKDLKDPDNDKVEVMDL